MRSLGAYDYFTKPYNLDEVAISIERALNMRRLELESWITTASRG
jgi:DNA-binding NtrC family response regulator